VTPPPTAKPQLSSDIARVAAAALPRARRSALLLAVLRLLRAELPVLLLLLLVAVALWGFLELADEVAEGGMRAIDQAVLLALRNPADIADPLGPRWLEEAVRDVTALGSVAVLSFMTLAVAGYLLIERRWRLTAMVIASCGGALLLNNLLKAMFERPRPDIVAHAAEVFSPSFPSSHAMMSAVVYLTLGALLARALPRRHPKIYVLTLVVVTTVCVGLSRIYLGVHWPSDVLAGWALGGAWAILWWTLALLLGRRHAPA
jgi:undecaprenyl-diphosphatase